MNESVTETAQPTADIRAWSQFSRNIMIVLLSSGLLMASALTMVFIARQRAGLNDALSLRVQTLARSLARATFAPALLEDRAVLEPLLDGFAGEMDVVYLAVYTPDGRVIAQRPVEADLALPREPERRMGETRLRGRGEAAVREVILPLTYRDASMPGGQEVSGYVRIAMSEKRVDSQLRRVIAYGLAVATGVLVAAFSMGALLTRRMTWRMREFQERIKATAELERSNKELEAFSYSVSHDLRAPLRSIDGFSHALLEDYLDKLDDVGKDYLHRVRAACQRMGQLIDDLLGLSRIIRHELRVETVDLSAMARSVFNQLAERDPGRKVRFDAAPDVRVTGDPGLLRAALENLIGNAWKFTEKTQDAAIEFGVTQQEGRRVMFVRDNGAGFDMTYVNKLFGAFQRLHEAKDFPGTGIGLATVQRIISRHGGRVWAEGAVGKGATFFFVLPNHQGNANGK